MYFGSVCFSTIWINCALSLITYQPVCGIIVSASLCLCLHLCKSQCWYMFINNRKGMCVCLRVCAFVCVYELSEKEEWFHLDLSHLGGNLLVNRLVHELRRVHLGLFVCNIAVNLGFFRSRANRPTDNWQGAAKSYVYFARKCAPFVIPQFSGSWKFPRQTFCRIPRTYGEGAHCYNIVTKLMQFSPQSNAVLLWSVYYSNIQRTRSGQVLVYNAPDNRDVVSI